MLLEGHAHIHARTRAPTRALPHTLTRAHTFRTYPSIGCIYSSATAGGRTRVRSRWCHRSVAGVAAGVTWTNRTTSALWAARCLHTSVIDAAGAIYVIGGGGIGGTAQYPVYNDVYVSTNGGADRTRAGTREVIKGYSRIRGGTKGT